jgi:membrane associated rhomboid family serine protease
MLSDRSYMRETAPKERTNVLTWLIAAIIGGFVTQLFVTRFFNGDYLVEQTCALSPIALRHYKLWTLVSYSFLHAQGLGFLLHILGNVMGLYFLGNSLLPILGEKRFLILYICAVILGGLTWTAVNWHTDNVLIGASAGVMGLLVIFASFFPNQEMTFLLFFVVPITLKPKYIALGALFLDLIGCLFYEIMGMNSPLGFAHSAHLGGMATGWLYIQLFHNKNWWSNLKGKSSRNISSWIKKPKPQSTLENKYNLNFGNKELLRAEVDRILDKINSKGFGSLTAEEKKRLDEAKDLLTKG